MRRAVCFQGKSGPEADLPSPPGGEPYFHLDLDGTAGIVQVAANFLADGVADLLGQHSQRLARGTGAAFFARGKLRRAVEGGLGRDDELSRTDIIPLWR